MDIKSFQESLLRIDMAMIVTSIQKLCEYTSHRLRNDDVCLMEI